MLTIGYCMGIRSERLLCEEVHHNLAYRWLPARPWRVARSLDLLEEQNEAHSAHSGSGPAFREYIERHSAERAKVTCRLDRSAIPPKPLNPWLLT